MMCGVRVTHDVRSQYWTMHSICNDSAQALPRLRPTYVFTYQGKMVVRRRQRLLLLCYTYVEEGDYGGTKELLGCVQYSRNIASKEIIITFCKNCAWETRSSTSGTSE